MTDDFQQLWHVIRCLEAAALLVRLITATCTAGCGGARDGPVQRWWGLEAFWMGWQQGG